MVIFNYSDYTAKIKLILNDTNKFQCLGLVEENDTTAKIETKLQKRLLQLKKHDQLTRSECESIQLTVSQGPRMYGLPKAHKPSVQLRPILSMIGLSQHALAKWLSVLFQPLLDQYSSGCIKDSFTFAETVQKLATKPDETFICSFDIASLFYYISLTVALQIRADYFYDTKSTNTPGMEKHIFVELMNKQLIQLNSVLTK